MEPNRCVSSPEYPGTWNTWSYSKKAVRPDPPWNLLAETADLHAEMWCHPPATLAHLSPPNRCVLLSPPLSLSQRSTAHLRIGNTSESHDCPLCSRWQTTSSLGKTLSLGELARQRLQGIHGRRNDGATSAIFSARAADGAPSQGHRHAFCLPTDEDHDADA